MIPIARPVLGEAEAKAAQEAIASGWLTQGRQVTAFEDEFAAFVGARHACAVSSCTAALHLALLAAGVGLGDEVVTVSHSFIATANSILICNAKPVFVDIDPASFNIDPDRIVAAIGPRTKAILCVHQMGLPCDLDRIIRIGRDHGLPVIEDAACALGSEIRFKTGPWERIGRPHADVVCFSFHPRKIITTGDGGMLTCANPEWDTLFRLWRQHGMTVSDTVRHATRSVIFESYLIPGFNYRMTDIQAAIGRCQLERLTGILQRRRALAKRYAEALTGCDEVQAPVEPAWGRSNWQSYCVRLDPGCPQAEVMQAMLDAGIATRRGIMCAHLEDAYASHRPRFPLPHSEDARDHCMLLPLYPEMTDADQDRVAATLVAAAKRLRRRPSGRTP